MENSADILLADLPEWLRKLWLFSLVTNIPALRLQFKMFLIKDAVQVHSHFMYNVLLCGGCLVNMTPVVKLVIHCVFTLL